MMKFPEAAHFLNPTCLTVVEILKRFLEWSTCAYCYPNRVELPRYLRGMRDRAIGRSSKTTHALHLQFEI